MVAALTDHQLARLVATLLTVEGDPFTITYEAMRDGKARVTTDTSSDRFAGSGPTLTVETCDGPQPKAGVLTFARCTDPQPAPGSSGASTHT